LAVPHLPSSSRPHVHPHAQAVHEQALTGTVPMRSMVWAAGGDCPWNEVVVREPGRWGDAVWCMPRPRCSGGARHAREICVEMPPVRKVCNEGGLGGWRRHGRLHKHHCPLVSFSQYDAKLEVTVPRVFLGARNVSPLFPSMAVGPKELQPRQDTGKSATHGKGGGGRLQRSQPALPLTESWEMHAAYQR